MKRYNLLILYSLSGFVFLGIYLTAIVFSGSSNTQEVRSRRLVKARTPEKKREEPKLTEPEMRRLMREVEASNNRRIAKIEEVCRKYNLGLFKTSQNKSLEHPPVPQYSVFYFDRENKLSLCPIYKAGSSTWLYNLLLLSGMSERAVEASGKQLSVLARERFPELDPTEAEETLHKTIKILTVRHPFERLLSAYRDKLENTNGGRKHGSLHFYRSFGSKIVRKFRKGGNGTKTWELLQPSQYLWNPEHPTPAGIEPTFREFVLYLTRTNLVHYADDHWIPYYLFCTPCLLRYDVVAKVETMELDQLYAINVLGLQGKIKPRWKHKTQFLRAPSQDESLGSVPRLSRIYYSQLTSEEIRELYNKYKVDFDLFDYDYSKYLEFASDYSNKS